MQFSFSSVGGAMGRTSGSQAWKPLTAVAIAMTVATPVLGQRAAPDPNRPVSVLILDLEGDGHQLTDGSDGVLFDIDGTGQKVKVAWTAKGSDDGFLFIDTNGNGVVDSGRELLGDGWRMPDGSRSPSVDSTLAAVQGFQRPFPSPLPPSLGSIDRDDKVFGQIRVWRDRDHDGASVGAELSTLAELKVFEILLSFMPLGRKADSLGNLHNFGGTFYLGTRATLQNRRMTDITLARSK